jgi:hypothetical protein
MSASQRLSCGFHTLGLFLAAITMVINFLLIGRDVAHNKLWEVSTDELPMVTAALLIGVVAEEEAAAQSSKMTMSGADLLKAGTIADYAWIGFCNGYIQAAFDATGSKGICPPKGVTRNDLFKPWRLEVVLGKPMGRRG